MKFSFKVIHIAKSSSTLNKVLYCIVLHYIRSIFWCSRAASCVFKNSCFGLTYACIIFEPRLVGFSSVCNISFTIAYVQLLSSKISTRRELATKQRLPMSLFGELGTTISIWFGQKKKGNQRDGFWLARMNLVTHFDRSKTVGFWFSSRVSSGPFEWIFDRKVREQAWIFRPSCLSAAKFESGAMKKLLRRWSPSKHGFLPCPSIIRNSKRRTQDPSKSLKSSFWGQKKIGGGAFGSQFGLKIRWGAGSPAPSLDRPLRFQTIMGKTYTRFQTKTVQNPLGGTYLHGLIKGSTLYGTRSYPKALRFMAFANLMCWIRHTQNTDERNW